MISIFLLLSLPLMAIIEWLAGLALKQSDFYRGVSGRNFEIAKLNLYELAITGIVGAMAVIGTVHFFLSEKDYIWGHSSIAEIGFFLMCGYLAYHSIRMLMLGEYKKALLVHHLIMCPMFCYMWHLKIGHGYALLTMIPALSAVVRNWHWFSGKQKTASIRDRNVCLLAIATFDFVPPLLFVLHFFLIRGPKETLPLHIWVFVLVPGLCLVVIAFMFAVLAVRKVLCPMESTARGSTGSYKTSDRIRVVPRIEDMSVTIQRQVESLVNSSREPVTFGWIRLVERACASQNYKIFHYLFSRDTDGECISGYSFNVMLPGISAKNGASTRGPLGVFSSMLPLSNSTNIFVEEHSRGEFIQGILARMPKSWWPVLHIMLPHSSLEPEIERLTEQRFNKLPYYPGARLNLSFSSFDEYLQSLPPRWRRNIRSMQRKFTDAGCHFESIESASEHRERLYALYLNVALRNGKHGSPYLLHSGFVQDIEKLLPGQYEFRLAKRGSKIIGFVLLLSKANQIEARFMGQDYEHARETALYFNLFYESIRFAIERGATCLHMGITGREVKRRLGCDFEYPSFYIGGSPRWIGKMIKWIGAIPNDKFLKNA